MKDLQLGLVFPKPEKGVHYFRNGLGGFKFTPASNPRQDILDSVKSGTSIDIYYDTGCGACEYAKASVKGDVQELHESGRNIGGYPGDCHQKIINHGDMTTKTTTVSKCGGKEFKSFQRLDKDGYYSVSRKAGDKIVGGYEMPTKVKRTFAEGLKGKLQKTAIAISTDANGCERPVLRKVGELIFNILKKMK